MRDLNKKDWNKKVKESGGSFLQSWEWGEFQATQGREVKRFFEDSMLVQALKYKLPFNKSYYYIPHGPLGDFSEKDFIKILGELGGEEGTIFIKTEPTSLYDLPRYGFTESSKTIQPKITLILDLSKTEKQLLAGMKQKTRYNIHVAEKNGVIIEKRTRDEFEGIWPVFLDTAKRNTFRLHSFEYYNKLLAINDDLKIKLFVARQHNKLLAVSILAFWNDTVYYLHGASSDEFRNLMGNYLLHWDIVAQARRMGYKVYDFWGIDEDKWPGVTRFKRGFGGEVVNRLGAYDIAVSKFWYLMYNIYQKGLTIKNKIKK